MRENHTEVLVVGAGPVGLFSALLLGEAGLQVTVVDREANTAARSYACALHPGTLKLLSHAGLLSDLLDRARRINSLGFYEGSERCAEVRFSELPVEFPYVLILPQSDFEALLEERVSRLPNVHLGWNHRLTELQEAGDKVLSAIDKLNLTVGGYSVPNFEVIVQNTSRLSADFVIGADGTHSLTRRSLGIDCRRNGEAESFHVFEFQSNGQDSEEVRVALSGDLASVMWPISAGKCRWSFQTSSSAAAEEFPDKERRFINIKESAGVNDSRHQLLELLRARAPWFSGSIGQVDWSAQLDFQRQLATHFGRNRSWLAGDAVHQGSPVGMQSMNMGLREAARLCAAIKHILREGASRDVLQDYDSEFRAEWEQLLGLQGSPKPLKDASAWVSQHRSRLPEYLPASGPELHLALRQLGLSYN